MNSEQDEWQKTRFDSEGKRLPALNCPVCNYQFDAASTADGTDFRPSPGNFTVCLNCGEILAFTDTMGVRRLRGTELLDGNPEATTLAIKASQLIKRRGKIKS